MMNEKTNLSVRKTAVGVTVFYALALLLNAPALERNVENMDYGRARDVCAALVRPAAAVSRALRLDLPRRAVSRARSFITTEKEKDT